MMGEDWHVNGPVGMHILVCEECGEKTVLHGPFSVWCSRGTSFGCECGERLTLADCLDQKASARGTALRTRRRPPRRHTLEVGAPGKLWKSRTADWRGRTLTTDDVMSIIAVGACLVAFVACAVAHHLAASV